MNSTKASYFLLGCVMLLLAGNIYSQTPAKDVEKQRIERILTAAGSLPSYTSLKQMFDLDDEAINLLPEFWENRKSHENGNPANEFRNSLLNFKERNSIFLVRVLGNENLLEQLDEHCRKNGCYIPPLIPSPLIETDMNSINAITSKGQWCQQGRFRMGYIYALGLEHSNRSLSALSEISVSLEKCAKGNELLEAVENVKKYEPRTIELPGKDLSLEVLESAFFLSETDKKHATIEFLVYNVARNRSLLSLKVDHGILAEKFVTIVLEKNSEGKWKYFVVGLTGES